jgi:hypothetical protein
MSLTKASLCISPREFFAEAVNDALRACQVSTFPMVQDYLIGLLEHFLITDNLYPVDEETGQTKTETLAEMYLRAGTLSSNGERYELYKKLGDSSLYVSGFFGDSLQRKLVDIDYYIEMGTSAYDSLTAYASDDLIKKVYLEMAKKFNEFVDVLAHISQESDIGNSDDLLRLYEKYVEFGSNKAKRDLIEKGHIPATGTNGKKHKQ